MNWRKQEDCTTKPEMIAAPVETIGRPIFLLSKRTIKNPRRSDHQRETILLVGRSTFSKVSSFFNLAKTLVDSPVVFFTWLIRCTFPNPNWWAGCTQAWNRTTSHTLCCQKNMQRIVFPRFPRHLPNFEEEGFFDVICCIGKVLKKNNYGRATAMSSASAYIHIGKTIMNSINFGKNIGGIVDILVKKYW